MRNMWEYCPFKVSIVWANCQAFKQGHKLPINRESGSLVARCDIGGSDAEVTECWDLVAKYLKVFGAVGEMEVLQCGEMGMNGVTVIWGRTYGELVE